MPDRRLPDGIGLALATDVGRLRERNEDAVAGSEELRWALVADGMGGHLGGDVAAAIVAKELTARLNLLMAGEAGLAELANALKTAIEDANRVVFERALGDAQLRGMGSTVVVACLAGVDLVIGHVGDSRAYRYRDGDLEQLTHDHSLLQELLDGGMITRIEASRSAGRGVLTRSLGVEPTVAVDVAHFRVARGDLVLLCSDGLTEMLDDDVIAGLLGGAGGELDALAQSLIDHANSRGGRDNVSVVLMAPSVERAA